MKFQVFLLGSILVVALFFINNQSQANVGPPYIDPITCPSEHPWQDQNSPQAGDVITLKVTPGIIITVIPTKVIMIRTFQITRDLEKVQPLKKMGMGHLSPKGND